MPQQQSTNHRRPQSAPTSTPEGLRKAFAADAIDPSVRRIQPCESRLALSASLAGGLLLDALDVAPVDTHLPPCVADHAAANDLATGSVADAPTEQTQPIATQPLSQGNASLDGIDVPTLLDQAAALRTSDGLTGSGQTVAVIDSGVAWDHVALGGGFGPGYRVVAGWDFAENDATPYDDGPSGFHGTHIAGLIGGDSPAMTGIAPQSDIVSLRVFDDNGAGELEWIESALQWVIENQDTLENPITTVNLSVGAALDDANRDSATAMLSDELQQLRDDGILVFAAAGNFYDTSSPSTEILYPASDPNVIAVTSIGSNGSLSDFAQRASGLFAADGDSVASSVPDHVFGWDGSVDDYAQLSGTSMATPQVAAASMLLREALLKQGIEATPDELLSRLESSAIHATDPATGATYFTLDLQSAIDGIETGSGGEGEGQSLAVERFDGSGESEHAVLDLRQGIRLQVGGQTYDLSENAAGTPMVIDIGGGADSLQIIGSDAAERVVFHPPSVGNAATSSLSTNEFSIELRGFEDIVFTGGGGADRATLYDSAGDDTLRSYPTSATVNGVGYSFEVDQVSRIYVHATAGGADSAFMYDSDGDDSLSVRPQFTSLRGDGFFQSAYGFEKVYAYATAGGVDSAELYDSVADDTMSISATRSILTTDGYQANARGFESVVAYATAGGDDLVRIYSDESQSQWHETDDLTQWTSENGVTRQARGFERVMAFENFESVEITPQSSASDLVPWFGRDDERSVSDEIEASRSIFEQFGRDE